MNKKWVTLGIVGAVLLIVIVALGGTYNSLVVSREKVTARASDLQSQYQRRADLVKQAIGVVKGSSSFEQETLTKVVEARAKATSTTIDIANATPEQIQQFQAAQNDMNGAFSRLLVTVEQYPDIKSTQAYQDMLTQVEGTENRVAVARKDYNDTVNSFNTQIQRFPTNLTAGLFGFHKSNYFQSEQGVESAPVINFGS